MVIPLGINRAHRRRTVVNHVLIAANIAVFVAVLAQAARVPGVLPGTGQPSPITPTLPIVDRLELVWKGGEPWRLITYAFVHDPKDWFHIIANMVFLLVFGPSVEDRLGRMGYLLFYLGGAAVAGGAHVLWSAHPVIGASGAVAGVTGIFLVLFPRAEVRVLLFFILVGVFSISSMWFIGLAIARDVFMLVTRSHEPVAWIAHLAGYAYGIGVGLVLLGTGVLAREPFDLLAVLNHVRRRQEIREAGLAQQRRVERVAPGAKREPAPADPAAEEIATLRADAAARIARSDMSGAATVYRDVLMRFGESRAGLALSKQTQVALANYLVESGDHRSAIGAYRVFLAAYPHDPQVAHTRLVIGLLYARYLGHADAARGEIQAALPALRDDEDLALARQLLSELDRAQPRTTS